MNKYVENYQPNKIYVGNTTSGQSKYISMIIRDKQVSKTIFIRLTYIKPKDQIVGISIAKYQGSEKKQHIDFLFKDYANLIDILEYLKEIDYQNIQTEQIDSPSHDDHNTIKTTEAHGIFNNKENPELFATLSKNPGLINIFNSLLANDELSETLSELLKSDAVSSKDIVNVGYRRKQLHTFYELLQEKTTESIWQKFFENNPWIFGYGLNYIFNAPLEGQKMEQITKGHDLTSSGKKPDAFLSSSGTINSVCLVEIKTNSTPLLKPVKDPYRADSWAISDELAGAISQSQKTLQKTTDNLRNKFEPKINGDPTGHSLYLYNPKTYVITGNLSEFRTEHGINEEKFSSFQLFRRNIMSPEIITFDELYERAKNIVEYDTSV